MCNKILTNAENCGFNKINIDTDYYLKMLDPYDLYSKKPKTGIGSFVDDWDWLKKVLNKKNPVTIVDFERLANVIKIVANEIEKSKNPFIDTEFTKDND